MDKIVWQPQDIQSSRMWKYMRFLDEKKLLNCSDYSSLHRWSVENPEAFWSSLPEFLGIKWDKPPQKILSYADCEHSMIKARWFEGAFFNYAKQLLSGKDDKTALISLDETGKKIALSYAELRQAVADCAAGLRLSGIEQGDRVAAIMPNVSYTLIAFLATASIGAIWSSCSTDFGTQAAVDRLGQIEPKLLFISDSHQYQGKVHDDLQKAAEVKALIPSIQKIVICPVREPHADIQKVPAAVHWEDFIQAGSTPNYVSLPFSQPLYILFSSGTTGRPKCIVHGAGGVLLQHSKELALHSNIDDKDRLFFYTTCGWMMWNWMVSVLALGATLILYEGAPMFPLPGRLFQLIEEESITVFGTSAKYLSELGKTEFKPKDNCTLKSLKSILSTGSPLLAKHYDFVYQDIKSLLQLSSISGGTDIVSCFALGNPILPVHRGELQCMGLGMDVQIFDEAGKPVQEQRGELVCCKPFPSMPLGFWNDAGDKKYRQAYFERFPGVWAHGDFAEITANQGLIIYGRSDTVLNPGGVRIGTAEIYRQVEKVPEVLDSVVISQDWQDDVRIVLFVKLRPDLVLNAEIEDKIRKIIRSNASARHVPAKILQVADIPKTINNKVVELAVRQIVHGQTISNVQSLANPEALEYFKNRVELTM